MCNAVARKLYPSDLTDAQWELLAPYIPEPSAQAGLWQGLLVRHEVACVEWSGGSQSSIQDCPQSLSASLVTVGWKARGNAQGSF
jgi:transposase